MTKLSIDELRKARQKVESKLGQSVDLHQDRESEELYVVNGANYTRAGLISRIDELMRSEMLPGFCAASIGKVRRKIDEYGENPTTYLTIIANAEKEARRRIKSKNELK